MKDYTVTIIADTFMWATVEVEAESIEDAKVRAMEQALDIPMEYPSDSPVNHHVEAVAVDGGATVLWEGYGESNEIEPADDPPVGPIVVEATPELAQAIADQARKTGGKIVNSKITSGPWDLAAGSFYIAASAGNQRVQGIYQHNKIQKILAFVPVDIEDDGTINKEQEANAALIAASPELREKLAELVKQMYALATDECTEWRDAKALLTRLRNAGV